MKMDVRTSVALCLLAATAVATAQNAPQEPQPAPQQSAPANPPPQATPPAPSPQQNVQPPPATPPLPRLPPQQYQYTPPPQSPPPPQYQYQYTPPPSAPPPPSPPPARLDKSQWTHSEKTYYEHSGFKYHPFRFHIDGGGTITQRSNENLLDNGWNAGLGFSWYPTSQLPLGVRVDGTYNEFSGRTALLDQATSTYGTRVDNATRRMWGGDVDLEFDLPIASYVRMYLLAGGGWYREQTTYRQRNYYTGLLCDWWGCDYGYYGVDSIIARNTTDWHFAKNAGLGFEFAMSPWTSFFVEARYMRLNPKDTKSDFIPIRAGLRF